MFFYHIKNIFLVFILVTGPSFLFVNCSGKTSNNSNSPDLTIQAPRIKYSQDIAIPINQKSSISPSNTGGSITDCSISPNLPQGLNLQNTSCIISGTPTALMNSTKYTVIASNISGTSSAIFNLKIIDAIPIIKYSQTDISLIKGQEKITITPEKFGGAITSCRISPTLPEGLEFST